MNSPMKHAQGKMKPLLRHFLILNFTFDMCLLSAPAWAFKIVEPAEKTPLKSGESVTATVDVGSNPGIVKVLYYWYNEPDETLVQQEDFETAGTVPSRNKIAVDKYLGKDSVSGSSIVAIPSLVSNADKTPPFGGPLKVPKEAIGAMRLLAVAEVSRGRLGTRSEFDEVVVHVEPKAELTGIDFETDKPLHLGRAGQAATYGQIDSMGKTFELPVVGEFADGVTRSIRHPSTGTAYQSSNERVIKVLSDGLLQIVGNGRAVMTVSNRGKEASLDVTVEVNDEPNELPLAIAGPSRTVKGGAKVELNGLMSRDPEGEALFYTWSQVRGAKVPLLDLNMPRASFAAPQVSEKRLFRFKLRVTDKKGADSLPAYVDVTVEP
ncbi:MAG: PKD domain-containing protein [Nitrospiraceae bacterium]